MINPNFYYTVDELMNAVGRTRRTIYRWINEGNLPAHKMGKSYLIKGSDLLDWTVPIKKEESPKA